MHIRWVRYPIACTVESTGPSNTAEMAADREDRRSRAAEASRAEQEREIRFMGHPLEEWGYRLMGRAGQAESVWQLTGRAEQAGRAWRYLGRAGQADRVWQKGLPAQV